MKRSRVNIALATLTTAVIVSVIGTLTGSLAWYAYATRAVLSFTGTSAYASERLRVGIHDSNGYLFNKQGFNIQQFAADHEIQIDTENKIIWGKEGEGLTGDIIATYLEASPYSAGELPPVTSLHRGLTDRIQETDLKKAPLAMNNDKVQAPRNYYTRLPLCFKVLDSDSKNISNQDIWLTGVSAIDVPDPETNEVKDLSSALRLYFENKYAIAHADDENPNEYNDHRYFVVNPTSTAETTGNTVVAGVLDLKGDGTYDYEYRNDGNYEIIYGDYDNNTISYTTEYDTENLVDINGTNKTTASTFLAKHAENIFAAQYNTANLRKAAYDTMFTIGPKDLDEDGHYDLWSGKPVAHTNEADPTTENDKLIAYCDLIIYLEGWDHAIINEVISARFNLGLQFEVDHL